MMENIHVNFEKEANYIHVYTLYIKYCS